MVLPLRKADAPASPKAPPLAGLLQILALLCVIGNIPVWILQYLVSRPAAYTNVLAFLLSKFVRTMSFMYPFIPAPEAHGEAARPPKAALPSGGVKADTIVVGIQPVPKEWRTAYATEVGGVKAVERPGFMLSTPGAKGQGAALAQEGEKVVLYIHGGAYIRGHPLYTPFPAKVANDTSLRVLGCQYRKCLDDSSGFPAPLLDVLAAYRYLTTTLGFAASDILVAGESAGGHATLALVAQLDALQLPLPGGLVMCSPWVDFTNSFQSWQRNTDDILTKPSLDRAVRSACRHYDTAALVDPFFSPSFAPPSHWKFLRGIPVFLSYGTAEAFEDEIEALVRSMRSDDIEVAIYKDIDGIHVAPMLPLQGGNKYATFRDGILEVIKKMDHEGVNGSQ